MSAGTASDQSSEAPLALLLVEDDQLAADRIFDMLGRPGGTGFEITHVRRVEEALEKLQADDHDVVLLDLSIHEGYGLDSLLRAQFAARAVPIVVLAYQDDEALALRAVRAGAQDYIIKGEATATLLSRTLSHAVERHRMLRELTEAKQQQQHMATHDALTGLPNRVAFAEDLRLALEEAERDGSELAVLFFDLDGFKGINDNLGHAAGDELLIDVAGRVKRVMGDGHLVARLGGDEFVAALKDVRDDDAPMRIAEQIREEIEKNYHVGGLECWVSASVGIAMYPRDGTDADLLTRRADTAMYHAKSHGRNHVCFFAGEMTDKAEERFRLVNGLREAIHGGDLILHFQPQVDVALDRIIAAETLVRWRHPTRGMVSPIEFITVAEETGMMIPLGEWVLRSACWAAVSWAELPDLAVAVNVSGRQLDDAQFPRRVSMILDETGLPPGRLELELTESLAATDSALRALAEIRELGVRVAIDDFGTGYSSLTLLKHLPVDILKLDQSFVRGARPYGPDEAILRWTIGITHDLGIDLVAEGVETAEEMNLLYRLGCHRMQGYRFAKPMPKEDFEREVTRRDAAWHEAIDELET